MRRTVSVRMLFTILNIALLAALGATPSAAQELDQTPLATMTIEREIVHWDLPEADGGLAMTVTGPAEYLWTAEFSPGEPPWFASRDADGNPLPDGLYLYELKLVPLQGDGIAGPPSQSGKLAILDGGFVMDASTENAEAGEGELLVPEPLEVTPMDNVISDDLIVQGSACVGNVCADGESFGNDRLRLRGPELQIHFDDTSTLEGHANQDWRILINDAGPGGDDYFAIEQVAGGVPFKIEVGASSNALYVEQGGDIGLGTADPAEELHISTGFGPGMGWSSLPLPTPGK